LEAGESSTSIQSCTWPRLRRKAVNRELRVAEWDIMQRGAYRVLFFEVRPLCFAMPPHRAGQVVNYNIALLDDHYVFQVSWRVNMLTAACAQRASGLKMAWRGVRCRSR
jgi:hypothetical protein